MLVTYILLSVIISIIIVFIIVYTVIYNRNANNVLKTGKRNVLLDKGKYINIFLVVAAFVMMLLMVINIGDLKQDVKNLSGQLSQIEQKITWLQGKVGSLEDELENYIEGQKNIYDVSYQMIDANLDEKTIEISLTFKLRELNLGNTYALEVINKENREDINKIELNNDTKQTVMLELLYNQTYEVSLIETTQTVARRYDIKTIDMTALTTKNYAKADIYKVDQSIYVKVVTSNPLNIAAFDVVSVTLIIKDKHNQIIFNQDIFPEMHQEQEGLYTYTIDHNQYDYSTNNFEVSIANGFGIVS